MVVCLILVFMVNLGIIIGVINKSRSNKTMNVTIVGLTISVKSYLCIFTFFLIWLQYSNPPPIVIVTNSTNVANLIFPAKAINVFPNFFHLKKRIPEFSKGGCSTFLLIRGSYISLTRLQHERVCKDKKNYLNREGLSSFFLTFTLSRIFLRKKK